MNNNEIAARRTRRGERGQIIIWLAVVWVAFFVCMAAIVCDLGYVYCCWRQLQASTDAATLAGAAQLPSAGLSSTVQTAVTAYGGYSGGKNLYTDMTVANPPTMTLNCSTTLQNQGIGCTPALNANALSVRQTATVPLNFLNFFSSILGTHPSMTITATSMAAMRGAPPGPFNIILIVDTTASMNSTDSGDCNNYRIVCAIQGVQVFLQDLQPCPAIGNCVVTDQNAANAIDEVGLMVFPGVAPTGALDPVQDGAGGPWQLPYEFDSSAGTPANTLPYTAYGPSGGPVLPITSTYLPYYEKEFQVVQLSSDYRVSDAAIALNSASDLVKAAENPSNGSSIIFHTGPGANAGLTAKGGQGTYYAGVLYAAQAELAAHSRAAIGAQNVIILLSDGDATASQSQTAYNATWSAASPVLNATAGGTYPSWHNECQQAVTAATYIKSQGTTIYVVAYGASNSAGSSCGTDNPAISACSALQNIASSPATFYSDTTATQNHNQCPASVNNGTNNLNSIFGSIAGSFTHARLIPNGTP